MPIKYGSLPFAEAIAFFRAKLNVPTEAWDDLWQQDHDVGFMVAGAIKAELLDDFRGAVDKAIAGGTTLRDFRKDFDSIVQRHGWDYNGSRGWRSRLIYETNLRTAYQAGRWTQIQNVKASRPYLLYRHSDSVTKPRPEHVAWDGKIIPTDDPWWTTHYPPNGWGCKCRAFAVNERTMKRLGKARPDTAPAGEISDWTDRHGNTHTVMEGIDPGWAYAPGASRVERIRKLTLEQAQRLPAALGQALTDELGTLRSPGGGIGGEKPRPGRAGLSGLAAPQAKVIARLEDGLARRHQDEKAYVIDADGNTIVTRRGAVDKVRFTAPELARMAGHVLTHNHPSGAPLSRADLTLAMEHGLNEVRAVTARQVYRAIAPPAGWGSPWDLHNLEREVWRVVWPLARMDAARYHYNAEQLDRARRHYYLIEMSKRLGFQYQREDR